MPARRSRTLHWKDSLTQIRDRGGALEIAVARTDDQDAMQQLAWRVQLIDFDEAHLHVDRPFALGTTIEVDAGVQLDVVLTIGQNKWMFTTECLGTVPAPRGRALRLRMPESVRRCQRREHDRIGTAGLNLPELDAWPLLDPGSVVVAERAAELGREIREDEVEVMPEIGPRFGAMVLNLGGGGAGLLVPPEYDQQIAHHKVLWLRVPLTPYLEQPLYVTGKVAHTHRNPDQSIYAGISFDFTHNAEHKNWVLNRIIEFHAAQQSEQLQRTRKSA